MRAALTMVIGSGAGCANNAEERQIALNETHKRFIPQSVAASGLSKLSLNSCEPIYAHAIRSRLLTLLTGEDLVLDMTLASALAYFFLWHWRRRVAFRNRAAPHVFVESRRGEHEDQLDRRGSSVPQAHPSA